jgi:pyruvate-ferredoxin/flavodoxin oxidoreductase
LYRYNPLLSREGKNPFTLDSKAPDGTLQEFLSGENRYNLLERTFPEESKVLRAQIEVDINERYEILRRMANEEPIQVSSPSPESSGGGEGQDTEHCQIKDVPEQSRPDSGEACDDGRASS